MRKNTEPQGAVGVALALALALAGCEGSLQLAPPIFPIAVGGTWPVFVADTCPPGRDNPCPADRVTSIVRAETRPPFRIESFEVKSGKGLVHVRAEGPGAAELRVEAIDGDGNHEQLTGTLKALEITDVTLSPQCLVHGGASHALLPGGEVAIAQSLFANGQTLYGEDVYPVETTGLTRLRTERGATWYQLQEGRAEGRIEPSVGASQALSFQAHELSAADTIAFVSPPKTVGLGSEAFLSAGAWVGERPFCTTPQGTWTAHAAPATVCGFSATSDTPSSTNDKGVFRVVPRGPGICTLRLELMPQGLSSNITIEVVR
jgi:hypothetical protein